MSWRELQPKVIASIPFFCQLSWTIPNALPATDSLPLLMPWIIPQVAAEKVLTKKASPKGLLVKPPIDFSSLLTPQEMPPRAAPCKSAWPIPAIENPPSLSSEFPMEAPPVLPIILLKALSLPKVSSMPTRATFSTRENLLSIMPLYHTALAH